MSRIVGRKRIPLAELRLCLTSRDRRRSPCQRFHAYQGGKYAIRIGSKFDLDDIALKAKQAAELNTVPGLESTTPVTGEESVEDAVDAATPAPKPTSPLSAERHRKFAQQIINFDDPPADKRERAASLPPSLASAYGDPDAPKFVEGPTNYAGMKPADPIARYLATLPEGGDSHLLQLDISNPIEPRADARGPPRAGFTNTWGRSRNTPTGLRFAPRSVISLRMRTLEFLINLSKTPKEAIQG